MTAANAVRPQGARRGRPPLPGPARVPRPRTGRPKLTAADVQLIRQLHVPASPAFGACALARRFGVTSQAIDAIVQRRTWADLP